MQNFQNFFIEFFNTMFINLIVIYLIFTIIKVLHIKILKKMIEEDSREYSKEIKIKKIEQKYFYLYISLITVYLLVNYFEYFITILSLFSFILIMALREQLHNIFLFIMFKSKIHTIIYEGMSFYFIENISEELEILKINPFKTICYNNKTKELISIENKELNSNKMIHKKLKNYNKINLKYIVPSDYNLKLYEKIVESILLNIIDKKRNLNYKELKKGIISTKIKYNIKNIFDNSIKFNYKYLNYKEIEIEISFNIFDFDFEEYNNLYLKLKPKIDLKSYII